MTIPAHLSFFWFQIVEPFTAHYVFALGVARFLSCAHWVLQVWWCILNSFQIVRCNLVLPFLNCYWAFIVTVHLTTTRHRTRMHSGACPQMEELIMLRLCFFSYETILVHINVLLNHLRTCGHTWSTHTYASYLCTHMFVWLSYCLFLVHCKALRYYAGASICARPQIRGHKLQRWHETFKQPLYLRMHCISICRYWTLEDAYWQRWAMDCGLQWSYFQKSCRLSFSLIFAITMSRGGLGQRAFFSETPDLTF